MKRIFNYVWPVLLCLAIGFTASKFQSESMIEWYPYLEKSNLTPPNLAFPIVWSVLYVFMGVALGSILNKGCKKEVYVWTGQMLLNFMWSIIFFTCRMPLWGFLDILLLDIFVLYFILLTYKKDKLAMYLFIPYMVWLLIATYLNAYILFNN